MVHRYLGMEKEEMRAYSAQQHHFVDEARLIIQQTMNHLLDTIKPVQPEAEVIRTPSSSEDSCSSMDFGLELSEVDMDVFSECLHDIP